jgi:hypothetical protein
MRPADSQTQVGLRTRPMVAVSQTPEDALRHGGTWDRRLYAGLRIAWVSTEVRSSLAEALGEVGVEAEYFLSLLSSFPGPGRPGRAQGDAFLLRVEAAARRLRRVAAVMEIATQGYLSALAAGDPEIGQGGDVWWPPLRRQTLAGEPIELRLRRCGYSYRHVVTVHLASNLEAIAEHMALVLHALSTLPPAGIVPAGALYTGLDELTSMLQGYLIPRHIADLNDQTPGLLSGIAHLRQLDASEGNSLETDLAWASAQYAFTHALRGRAGRNPTGGPQAQQWIEAALRDWQETIVILTRLRDERAAPRRP